MRKKLAMLMVSFLAFIGTVMAATLNPAMESASGTQELSPMTEAPKAGNRIMLKNGDNAYLGMIGVWSDTRYALACISEPISDSSPVIWELKATDKEGVFNLYNEKLNVYVESLSQWDSYICNVSDQGTAGKYGFDQLHCFSSVNRSAHSGA